MTTVVQVTIDGLRPDAIAKAECPTLKHLMATGAYSLNAKSVMPTMTLPCHTSIFHSVTPDRHGIVTNDWHPFARPIPGLVEILARHSKKCAFVFNWEPLRNLTQPDQLTLSYCYNTAEKDLENSDRIIAEQAAHYLKHDSLDYYFIYFGTVDTAGHMYGWMSDGYLQQISRTDFALGIVANQLPDDSIIIVQSDHGGHDRTHGTNSNEDMLIPWIISGNGIRSNHQIEADVSLLDTAPTILHTMGLNIPDVWEGRVVNESLLS